MPYDPCMPYKTIYIRDADMTWWDRAADTAKRKGTSLSMLVSTEFRKIAMSRPENRYLTPAEKLAEAERLINEARAELAVEGGKAETFLTAEERV